MKHGDFTELAKNYIHRPGYSEVVLKALSAYAGAGRSGFAVADVGAGTGKMTENLIALGLKGCAVEPNDAMRAEGAASHSAGFVWSKGSAENTGLPAASADWLIMASSFHWADAPVALGEFHRVLRPGGLFTAVWNPRDMENSPVEQAVEKIIRELVPELKRVSSGSAECTSRLDSTLVSTGHFADVLFVEARHQVEMSRERYIGVWRSVNDIRVQAGEERFAEIMRRIEAHVAGQETVVVNYKTRSWTVRRL